MKYTGKPDTTWNIPLSITFNPATFHVKSRKVDYLWDSVQYYTHTLSLTHRWFELFDLVPGAGIRLSNDRDDVHLIVQILHGLNKS